MTYKPLSRAMFYVRCAMTSRTVFIALRTSHLALFFIAANAFGQAPVITHIDKYINGNGQRVTISGTNFGGVPANLSVWFGAAKGVVETASDQTIEVTVPPGATYESIIVTNTSTGKSASSKGEFLLSYGGQQPIALANFVAQTDLDAEAGLYDVCLCDLDGDGKNDVAASNSGGNSPPPAGVSLFRNTSTATGPFAFAAKTSLLPSTKTLNIKCGDLNGDGKKDLLITEADPGNKIFILKNASVSGSFIFTTQNLSLPGKSPKRVDIADLDRDGLPEIIVTDQNTENKDLLILPNTSSGGTISFGPHTTLTIPVTNNTGSDGLAIQDIDNDNQPDIIVSQVLSSSGNIFVYKNQSRSGTFVFDKVTKADIAPATPNNTGAPVNVRVGDIDGDTKPDITVTHFLGSRISVLLNQSTSTEVKFAAPVSIPTDPFPFGIDLGDLDGDGKLDIAVASLTGPITDVNPKSLTILNNTSTAGSVSFLPRLTQATTFVNRHIVLGDLNGDSKPDIMYTSVDDNTRGVPASKLSFFKNLSCITPVVTPGGPMVVCASFPITLKGTISGGATYLWKKDNVDMPTETNSTFTPSLPGIYTLSITSDGCTKTSNAVDVDISAGAATAPAFTNNSPVCAEGTINLTATSAGADSYAWTGPAGFTANTASVTRTPYKPEYAGRYEVEVTAGGCIAAKGSTLVETISLPPFSVGFPGSDVFCTGDTKMLTASPSDANFTYQWTDANGNISGATTTTLNVNTTGTYAFNAKSTLYPGCPEVPAEPVQLTLASTPVAAFQSPVETCKDTPVTFTNQSTVASNAGAHYVWDFGDTGTSTDVSPVHTYTTISNLTVKLTASYRGDACPVSLTKPIKISALPTATITAPDNVFKFCDGDKVTLSVTPAFSEYLWSTNASTPTIDATTGGNYSVQLKNAAGCKISVSKEVIMLPKPEVVASATPNPINIGESTDLSATGGFTSYEWSPAETLDSSEDPTPKATPQQTTTYTVTVVNSNGCVGEGIVEVVVIVDNPSNLLKPANFFSPNADATNPTWNVGNILSFPGCGVTIFDEKGLKVYEAKPYLNDWDGISNSGKKVPDGVYYYLIRCEGDTGSRTGSITILR
ncbi:MAG TPA: FG-GAP-like repeat-containing protein [Cyclobacteriaceae bacterium]|nr:FG-GAP-like repeat-containing protein [Cyclobacteriaceae bacterium]